jgi:hypothetical protein
MFKPCSLQRAAVLAATAVLTLAHAQGTPDPTRGELLYATHCIECHNSQRHWRDKRLATDWASLKAQVAHWQAVALLNWGEADIVEVTRHLNRTIYRFAPPADLRGAQPVPYRAAGAGAVAAAAAGGTTITSAMPPTQPVVWPALQSGWSGGAAATGGFGLPGR